MSTNTVTPQECGLTIPLTDRTAKTRPRRTPERIIAKGESWARRWSKRRGYNLLSSIRVETERDPEFARTLYRFYWDAAKVPDA